MHDTVYLAYRSRLDKDVVFEKRGAVIQHDVMRACQELGLSEIPHRTSGIGAAIAFLAEFINSFYADHPEEWMPTAQELQNAAEVVGPPPTQSIAGEAAQ